LRVRDVIVTPLHEALVTAAFRHPPVAIGRQHARMTHSTAPEPFVVEHLCPVRRSLRIAVMTETYPPEINGVALTLQQVVLGLHARGHDVQLVRPRQDGEDAAQRGDRLHEVLMRGVPIPRYPDMKMGVPALRALAALWQRQRPDVVHIATEGPLGWSALKVAQKLKLPVCSEFRTNFHAYSHHYGIGWLARPIMGYLRRFHNRTHCTMVPSDALRDELHAQGFERLLTVSRGVDTQLFDPAHRSDDLRRRWGAAPDTPVVLFVGRLAPEKNLTALARAFSAMQQSQPAAKLVLVGDGPAAAALAAAVPGAVFAGTQRGAALAAHYASADCFVFPSMTETFGNVTLEAMASGLPVLAYHHASASQMIASGVNGLTAPLGDEDAFVELARHLMDSPAHGRRMGEQARIRAHDAGWSHVVAQVEDVLHAAAAGAAGARTATAAAGADAVAAWRGA